VSPRPRAKRLIGAWSTVSESSGWSRICSLATSPAQARVLPSPPPVVAQHIFPVCPRRSPRGQAPRWTSCPPIPGRTSARPSTWAARATWASCCATCARRRRRPRARPRRRARSPSRERLRGTLRSARAACADMRRAPSLLDAFRRTRSAQVFLLSSWTLSEGVALGHHVSSRSEAC